MLKKSQMSLRKIVLFIIILSPLLLFSSLVESSPNQPDNRSVGFEMIGDETLHLWNEIDSYCLNMTSGIQFGNCVVEEGEIIEIKEFTHNIFCAGYKTTQWNYLCNDDLPIQLTVFSDNLTYVRVNGTRVINIAGRNIGMGIDYLLESGDDELSITTGLKHLSGNPISNDLGFAWRVNDIKIDNTYENDRIFVNNSWYNLNDSLDLLFKNMTNIYEVFVDNSTLNQTCFDECVLIYNDRGYCYEQCVDTSNYTEIITDYIPFYKLVDDSYVSLRWNHSLNYFLQIKNTSQYNAPVTLAIVTSGLGVGQTKKATFFWRDPAPVVTLISPIDGATDQPSDIGLLANMTTGVLLYNFSLWHDITGTWTLNRTDYAELPSGNTYDPLNDINMSGAIFYLRCNNDSSVGSNDTYCYDWTDLGNGGYGVTFEGDEIQDSLFNKGINFSGDDSLIILDSALLDSATGSSQPRAWGYWIKITTQENNKIITEKANVFQGEHFWCEEQGLIPEDQYKAQCGVDASDNTLIISPLYVNKWEHIVITYNGSHERAYLNGVLVDGPDASTPLEDDNYEMSIGGSRAGKYGIKGKMDDKFLFNRSLSANEVQRIYNVTKYYKINYSVDDIPDGTYKWNVEATDNDSSSAFASTNFTFTVGSADSVPVVNLISPANDTQSTNSSYNFTCQVSDDFKVVNTSLYVWYDNGTIFNISINTTNFTVVTNVTFEVPDFTADTYEWNCLVYDNASQSSWNATNYTLTVTALDSCTPPGVDNDWTVQCSDNCSKNAENINLGTGDMIINGTSGSFTINNTELLYADLIFRNGGCTYKVFGGSIG